MTLRLLLAGWLALFLFNYSFAAVGFQDNSEFFLGHLKQRKYSLDTNANAIVLYENGITSLAKTNTGDWYHVKTIHKVIKILTKDGVHLGDVVVPYIKSNLAEVRSVKARTYNLENGQVKVQEMEKSTARTESYGRRGYALKFSLPSVKEGCIIDYSYEIAEGFSYIFDEWEFQENIPKLHSEFTAMYHHEFKIVESVKSFKKFETYDDTHSKADSLLPDYYTTGAPVVSPEYVSVRWVHRNVKPYFEEPFIYNTSNYTERINLLVGAGYQYYASAYISQGYIHRSWSTRKFDIATWEDFNKTIYKDVKNFTNRTGEQNIKKVLDRVAANEQDSLQLAKKIYRYVRDSFYANDDDGFGWGETLDKVLEEKRGSPTQLNNLLYTMYQLAGFKSNMVAVGSRNNLRLSPVAPMITGLGGMICYVKVAGAEYFLDVSKKYTPFGVLVPEYYNGFCWIIGETGHGARIEPDAIKEKHIVVIKTKNADVKDYRVGVQEYFGNCKGPELREEWRESPIKAKEFVLNQLKTFSSEVKLLDYSLKGLYDADSVLAIDYTVKMNWGDERLNYFNPVMFKYFNSNPFYNEKRSYPIEMESALDIIYSLNLTLPQNYTADEIPKSVVYKIDDENLYRYLPDYKKEENTIVLNTRLTMPRAYFDAEGYTGLRDFFDKIMDQQQKFILVKKIQ